MPDYDAPTGPCSNAEHCRLLSDVSDSESRFREIAELVGDWVWETDANHRIVSVGGRMIGENRSIQEDILGKTVWNIAQVEPEKDAHWTQFLADLDAHRPFRNFNYSARDPDGNVRYLVSNGTPFFGRDGRFKGFRGATIDLTAEMEMKHELERSRAELLESREHLAQAQAVGRIGSAKVDTINGNDHWSDELYRILGYEPGSVRGNYANFLKLVHPAIAPMFVEIHSHICRGDAVQPSEFRIVRPDGKVRWLYRQGNTSASGHGSSTIVILTFQDVTERRRIEEDLRHSQEHLARVQDVAQIGSSEVNLSTQEVIWSDMYYRTL